MKRIILVICCFLIGGTMQLSEVFSKIANNTQLNQAEKDFFIRTGDDLQLRASEVGGWTGADGRPFFRNGLVSGGDIQVGKNVISTNSIRIKNDTPVTTANSASVYAKVQFTTVEYNDGFIVNLATANTKITIPSTGIYAIFYQMFISDITDATGCFSGIYLNNTTSYYPVDMNIAFSGFMLLHAYDERALNTGDFIELRTLCNGGSSGGNYTVFSSALAVRKVRSGN